MGEYPPAYKLSSFEYFHSVYVKFWLKLVEISALEVAGFGGILGGGGVPLPAVNNYHLVVGT